MDVREFALGNFVSRSISGSSLISWRCDGNFLFANCIRSSPVQDASDYPAALFGGVLFGRTRGKVLMM